MGSTLASDCTKVHKTCQKGDIGVCQSFWEGVVYERFWVTWNDSK